MATVVTINRPDVVALIAQAAEQFTSGNKTEAVALALKQMLDRDGRSKPLFGAHRGSVTWIDPALDLTQPTFALEDFDAYAKPLAANLRAARRPSRRKPRL